MSTLSFVVEKLYQVFVRVAPIACKLLLICFKEWCNLFADFICIVQNKYEARDIILLKIIFYGQLFHLFIIDDLTTSQNTCRTPINQLRFFPLEKLRKRKMLNMFHSNSLLQRQGLKRFQEN